MTFVRVRVSCRGRTELCELEGPEIEIGRDEACALVVHHPSVAPRHARLLVRRGRLIVADIGKTRAGITRGRERVLAPVTLGAGEPFRIGEVALSAWQVDDRDRALSGLHIGGALVGDELETSDASVRRYRARFDADGESSAEASIANGHVAPHAAEVWLERMRASSNISPEVLSFGRIEAGSAAGRAYAIERVERCIRLSVLCDRIERGAIHLPIEAAIVVIAHLADALVRLQAKWGAHGALEPEHIMLGLGGTVSVLRPGPVVEFGLPDAFVSPERRFDPTATFAGDAFALGTLGKQILGRRSDCPMRLRAICCWLAHVEPRRRPTDLQEVAGELRRAAHNAAIDPTCGHVARTVRLVAPTENRPLCSVRSVG